MHDEEVVPPEPGLYWPATHEVQPVAPVVAEYLPAAQLAQRVMPVLAALPDKPHDRKFRGDHQIKPYYCWFTEHSRQATRQKVP